MNTLEPHVEKIWLRNYPSGVPAEIDPGRYRSLKQLFEESFEKFRPTNFRQLLEGFREYKDEG